MNLCFAGFRFFAFFSFLFTSFTHAHEGVPTDSYASYFNIIEASAAHLGPRGSWENGEIEIVTDRSKMAEVEQVSGRKVGVVYRDKYWVWLNDVVRFPAGNFGVYGRILWNTSLKGEVGVAIFCLTADGRVVLNCNYRHATRSWELELPRGGAETGERIEETARRELLEETGLVIGPVVPLGEMAIDSGVQNSVVPVVMAKACGQEKASPEETEAIAGIVYFDKEGLFLALREGTASVVVGGKHYRVCVRDPFLTFAILQAQIRGMY